MTSETCLFKTPVWIDSWGCLTPFGDVSKTASGLLRSESSLRMTTLEGLWGGEPVPLSLYSPILNMDPPRWIPCLKTLVDKFTGDGWGTRTAPVVVTSSNFGSDQLFAFSVDRDPQRLTYATPHSSVEQIRQLFGWGKNLHIISHACVSSNLGILHASRMISSGLAERALVFSYDFINLFVASGFHSLKILNNALPKPYADEATGSIGLGDGIGWIMLTKNGTGHRITAQATFNEMFHMTANSPDGDGFDKVANALKSCHGNIKLWLKGHGTGTLDAGRMESCSFGRAFPEAPLVSWKGGLGHTLGSCGLVELAVALECTRLGKSAGTVGTIGKTMGAHIQTDSFSISEYDGFIAASNAFGGAHSMLLVTHD